MIRQIFSVYDSKAEAYLRPFMVEAIGQATRSFMDVTQDPNHEFSKHPEDYTLFHIGEFDDLTAKYKNKNTPISMGTALEFQTQKLRQLPINKTAPEGAEQDGAKQPSV